MQTNPAYKKQLTRIRLMIVFFMVALTLSGITAFPLETELHWLLGFRNSMPDSLAAFIEKVYDALQYTNAHYPMLAYGYDWLAFAHIVIALFFIGPLRDPVKNIWVIEWGMIACVAIIPLAFIARPIRGIPLYWTLIDCFFWCVWNNTFVYCVAVDKAIECDECGSVMNVEMNVKMN